MILGVHHAQITVPSRAEAEARAFYLDVLGLLELEKPDALKPRGGFWARVGMAELHVALKDGANRTATKAHLAYLVADLEPWRVCLEAAGCVILASVPIPGYARFETRDPFGNRLEFIAHERERSSPA
jgi:catechol 2,3-dioxygenase-like lactoylglutathione lyase family enzyme